ALLSCQKRIEREVAAIPQRRGMGSTLTLCYIVWPKMFVVHVGDSRCYLMRGGHLQPLTRDHTLAHWDAESEPGNGSPPGRGLPNSNGKNKLKHPLAHVLWNVIKHRIPTPAPWSCRWVIPSFCVRMG
ncbi:MAG: hypothetical protein KDA45_10675, partial [Planctomycetales bacterium]|nr:hypothetical protein [Planctomycetales bacterium]